MQTILLEGKIKNWMTFMTIFSRDIEVVAEIGLFIKTVWKKTVWKNMNKRHFVCQNINIYYEFHSDNKIRD